MTPKTNPTAAKRWSSFHRTNIGHSSENEYATINRFIARYRLAKSFRGLELEGYNQRTVNGYNGIFHVHLAFSAFECLLNGIKSSGFDMQWDKNEHNHQFNDEKLANLVRCNQPLLDLLVANLDAKQLIGKVILFRDSTSTNVAPIVKGIRNMVAHGELSSTGAVAGSQKHTKTLHSLALLVLHDGDQIFTEFVDKITALHAQ